MKSVLVVFALASLAFAQKPREQSLETRLQLLEDKEEIRTLLLDYGRTLDARDFAGYSRLFAADGEWVGGFGSVRGPAAIETFMIKNMGTADAGKTYHLLTNFEIEVHGDAATAWSRWAYVVKGADGKPTMQQGGHYDDALIRENGHWRFKKRSAVSDISPLLPAAK